LEWSCRRHCRLDSDITGANDQDRNLALDEVVGQGRQALDLTVRPSIFDGDVSPLDESHFAEAAAESGHAVRALRRRYAMQRADHGQ
jgi:hypothetical protein